MTRFSEEWYARRLAASAAAEVTRKVNATPAGQPGREKASGTGVAPLSAQADSSKADARAARDTDVRLLNRVQRVEDQILNTVPLKRGGTSHTDPKYGNVRTNGYASKREAARASRLRLMQEAGAIRNLQEQVRFLLIPKQDGERACHYVADFVYEEWGLAHYDDKTVSGWRKVVEDCKGYRTEIYRIKRKLMQMVHGIRIKET